MNASNGKIQCRHGHWNSNQLRFCTTCGESLSKQSNDNVVSVGSHQPSPTVQSVSPHGHCQACSQPLGKHRHVCLNCQWIKPLFPGHVVVPAVFQWSLDGQAMAKLQSVKPLVAVARRVSQRVGRPWIEATYNGIRLGYRQMPQVYGTAVQAARLLGLQRMPGVYVSGERPWNMMTFGSDDDAFIVVGSALVSCFQKSDLMFLFAREIGHILAGHALWKTVIQILVGEQNAGASMMRHGVAGMLDPSKLIEGAIELPLLGWARQAEITADRAGLLASAGLEQARRVLMMWSLKSPVLFRQINLAAWLQQQEVDTQADNIRLAEMVTSSTPYLTRRLRLLQDYDTSHAVSDFRKNVMKRMQRNTRQVSANQPRKLNVNLISEPSNRQAGQSESSAEWNAWAAT